MSISLRRKLFEKSKGKKPGSANQKALRQPDAVEALSEWRLTNPRLKLNF